MFFGERPTAIRAIALSTAIDAPTNGRVAHDGPTTRRTTIQRARDRSANASSLARCEARWPQAHVENDSEAAQEAIETPPNTTMNWRKARFIGAGLTIILLATYGAATLVTGLGFGPDVATVVIVAVFLTALFMI